MVVFFGSLLGDPRTYFAIINNPGNLKIPCLIGAAVGAAVGFLRASN